MRASVKHLAVHPVLLGAYFVLFLYAQNLGLVRLSEVVTPLAWAVAGAAVVMTVAALVMRDWRRGALVASAVVVAFMGYGHVAELAGEGVSEEFLLGGWGLFIAAAIGLAVFPRTPLGSLTTGLNVLTLVLLVFTLSSIVPYNMQSPARADSDELAPTGLVPLRTTQRDIFYLVFDRYGSQSALEAAFGITDNDLPDWLRDQGFIVAEHSRANYLRTTLSMASVLNLEHLHSIAGRMGPDSTDLRPLNESLQEHVVGRFLREQGYRYIHIGSWFNPTRGARVADESMEADTTTEFEAVLYETTALPLIAEQLAGDEDEVMPPEDQKHLDHARFQLRAMQRVMGDPGPKFVLAHVLLPHDPYVFDEEGRYVSPAERADEPAAQQFRRQLEYTNREIRAYVEQLLARPENERPIIIIQADEGPYPERYEADQFGFDWDQATPQELEAKFGIINAFYLPPEPDQPADLPEPYPTISSVNTFRLVLGRYFGLDLPYRPDTSYTSRTPRLVYDLTDVTDRLPEP
jgi:hypothetical protein